MSEYFRKYIKKDHFPIQPSQIKFKTSFKNCILEAMKKRQWKEGDNDEWDINWTEKEFIVEVLEHLNLLNQQKVNHFRNHYELTRKDLMTKNIKKYKKVLEKEGKIEESLTYNFTPLTYQLPCEYSIFCEEFKKVNQISESKQLWIMKPIGKSQGKGIFIFRNIKDISSWKNQYKYNPDNPSADPYVVQKYISDPLLIGGKKFDMRIYALCTSYQPLTIYLYRTGFARFTHHRYDLDDINNVYVHLTNVAIQKNSDNYDKKLGGKWLLQKLKLFLISKYGQEKVDYAFFQVQNIIIKSMLAVQKVIVNDKRCFELYGFDIILDSSLKPWLLEINSSPSMTANTQQDSELKQGILDDTFTIIDLEKVLTGQEEQIGGFDLIYKGDIIKLPSNSTYNTLLGSYNNRIQQLKKLAKNTALRLAIQHYEKQQNQINQSQRIIQSNKVSKNQNQKVQMLLNNRVKQNIIINKSGTKSGYAKYNVSKQNNNNISQKGKKQINNQQINSQNKIGNSQNEKKQQQLLINQQKLIKQQQLQNQQQYQFIQTKLNNSQINKNNILLEPLNSQNNIEKFERYKNADDQYNKLINLNQKQINLNNDE
ncbi:tubulin-tyrosine ligase family protein, putative [Ichthyophthirius multifiliis]|uniref:Tubulin--tyrosine ligase-like protein 9 n=1 Tax=Ichthyophthirius multifiliis TaxID=5932 RepID=G0QSE4_ICHMU|nr:tubulin-tyrosine ligase family protein, putative [Ichthyophthirius multifiliis]EGR31891.1 tubulin-tyrosine ligase family protein, putative [Ichthyophthirius multifiliis]|eukprot:XP_004035377.1 tubulin-tyrosine ligase family protein, putative [Ichthyophthirius multifiliis]